MDINRNICFADLTDEQREAFIASFPCGRMREVYEKLKAEGAYNPRPPIIDPIEQIRKLSEEIERLKNAQNTTIG